MELEARKKITRPPRPKQVTYAFTFPQEYYADEQNYTNSNKTFT